MLQNWIGTGTLFLLPALQPQRWNLQMKPARRRQSYWNFHVSQVQGGVHELVRKKKNKTFFEVDCGKSESSIMFRFCVKLPGAFGDAWCDIQPARWISRSRGDRLEAHTHSHIADSWMAGDSSFSEMGNSSTNERFFCMVMLGYQLVIVEGWSCLIIIIMIIIMVLVMSALSDYSPWN